MSQVKGVYAFVVISQTVKPAPRKKDVVELHERLCYLLKELEPWDQKLIQVNKKAKIKLRREHESYVEETEKEEVSGSKRKSLPVTLGEPSGNSR